MNASIKHHIQEALRRGVRLDGRKLDEFRPITIETGVSATAEGSARVTCGETVVIAGVKLNVGTPYADRPDSGTLMVDTELLPMSNPKFEGGPPGIDAIETARVIDRGIRESKTVDEKALCITKGEKVWMMNIDVYPLNFDGNLIDVGGLAAIAAIKNARFPKLVNNKPDYHEHTEEKVRISGIPLPITVVKFGENLLVDPTDDEFQVADARLTITTLEDGSICSLQKGGNASLTIEEIGAMINLSIAKGRELRTLVAELE